MMKTIEAALAAAGGIVSLMTFAVPVLADENGRLIWSPSKTGDNAMTVRMGVRLPASVSAGADVAVSASQSGKVTGSLPVSIWGNFILNAPRKGIPAASRIVNAQVQTVTGAGSVSLETTRTRMVTSRMDFETRRSMTLRCNPDERHCVSFTASQAARVVFPVSATTLIAEGTFRGRTLDFGNSLAIEQKVTDNLDVRASVSRPMRQPRAAISLNYALKW